MKATLISQYYPPERGAVRYSRNLARGLVSRGHQVTVIAALPHFPTGAPHTGFGRVLPKIRIENSVRVIRTPLVMGSNRQNLRRLLGFLTFSLSALVWAVFDSKSDVVIASVPPATTATSGLVASWLRRCPLIVILRDIEPWRALRMRGWDRHVIGRSLVSIFMWIYRRASAVVVMHEDEIGYLIEQGVNPGRIRVIPHGLDCSQFQGSPVSVLTVPRRKGRTLFMYTGTIGLVHGLHHFLATIADPRIRELPFDVVIIGDGQYRSECERLVNLHALTNVSILPAIDPDEVPGALAQADVLFCTFRNHDNIPLCSKLYEYCAAGKPILVYGTNIAGPLVECIGNGLSCPAGDNDSLLRVLSDFLADPELWRSRGEIGITYAREHFAQSTRDEQWEYVLKQVSVRGIPRER